ncbi:hypothetical protein PFISCL1PPCAC_12438, partial [Pristionchus fissidentatus]
IRHCKYVSRCPSSPRISPPSSLVMNWHVVNPSSNCCLVVAGKRFYVERNYLSTQSTYFEALFNSSGKEEFEIKGIDSEMFATMMNVLHRFEIIGTNMFPVLDLSHKFGIKSVVDDCEQFLLRVGNIFPLGSRLFAADLYRLEQLKEVCMHELKSSDCIAALADLRNSEFWAMFSDNMKDQFFDALMDDSTNLLQRL